MSDSGEAAEQVVRMTIEGAEVALKLTGAAAERVTILIYSIMKGQQRTAGRARLSAMLKSGKEMSVFTIPAKDLAAFAMEAKRYGVLYCALKEKKEAGNGIADVMVYKDDAGKINRIVERLGLATVAATGKARDDAADAREHEELNESPAAKEGIQKTDPPASPNAADGKKQAERPSNPPATEERASREHPENPTAAEAGNPRRSERTSRGKGTQGREFSEASRELKKSVRKDMDELRAMRVDGQFKEAGRKRWYEKPAGTGKAATAGVKPARTK